MERTEKLEEFDTVLDDVFGQQAHQGAVARLRRLATLQQPAARPLVELGQRTKQLLQGEGGRKQSCCMHE